MYNEKVELKIQCWYENMQ